VKLWHDLILLAGWLLFNSKVVFNRIIIARWSGTQEWFGAIHLFRFDSLLLHFHSDSHLVFLLNLAGSDLTLHFVEICIWHLDTFTRRNNLIVQIVVIIICHLVLEEQVRLGAVRFIYFHVALGGHLELDRALNFEL